MSKQSQANIYIYEAQGNIKHVKDINNNSMQDIKTQSERERERDKQSQTFEICFYVPAFNIMNDFHYNNPARSLGIATPTTSSH